MTRLPKGRPTLCLVDLQALRWNFRQIRQKVGRQVKILSMVKANAYGHGAPAIAKTLAGEGSDAFGVATLEEGIELRQAGIGQPIIVVAGVYPAQIDQFLDNSLTPVIHEVQTLRSVEAAIRSRGAKLNIHLEVDTGMGRTGFLAAEVDHWLPELTKLKALTLEGVFSHFSDAESANEEYTENQLRYFLSVIKRLRATGITPSLVHMAKSAAVVTVPASHFTMVRPGLALYGLYPSVDATKEITLKPVLSWKTVVLQLKRVPKSSSLGYGRTFVTRRESLIATLPVGYADGYPRILSNRGVVLVRGGRAPVVGRVSMDLTMVDVTDIAGVEQGDEVVLLGRQRDAVISADEMAAWSNTISYEVLTSIGARVPRIYCNSREAP
ncbi:MAG TPA: alanine racemase [Candidatus Binatia bacterium]|nr:alanine racemase [Candidatus Binatia bacterium]